MKQIISYTVSTLFTILTILSAFGESLGVVDAQYTPLIQNSVAAYIVCLLVILVVLTFSVGVLYLIYDKEDVTKNPANIVELFQTMQDKLKQRVLTYYSRLMASTLVVVMIVNGWVFTGITYLCLSLLFWKVCGAVNKLELPKVEKTSIVMESK